MWSNWNIAIEEYFENISLEREILEKYEKDIELQAEDDVEVETTEE